MAGEGSNGLVTAGTRDRQAIPQVKEKAVGEKRLQIVPKGASVSEEEVPSEKQAVYVITDEEAAEIVKLAMALEVQ